MKLTKNEKRIIVLTNNGDYNFYYCKVHGLFAILKSKDTNGKCPWTNCDSSVEKIENIDELTNQFKSELKI